MWVAWPDWELPKRPCPLQKPRTSHGNGHLGRNCRKTGSVNRHLSHKQLLSNSLVNLGVSSGLQNQTQLADILLQLWETLGRGGRGSLSHFLESFWDQLNSKIASRCPWPTGVSCLYSRSLTEESCVYSRVNHIVFISRVIISIKQSASTYLIRRMVIKTKKLLSQWNHTGSPIEGFLFPGH